MNFIPQFPPFQCETPCIFLYLLPLFLLDSNDGLQAFSYWVLMSNFCPSTGELGLHPAKIQSLFYRYKKAKKNAAWDHQHNSFLQWKVRKLLKQNKYILFKPRKVPIFTYIGTTKMTFGTNKWYVETYRKKLEKTILWIKSNRQIEHTSNQLLSYEFIYNIKLD